MASTNDGGAPYSQPMVRGNDSTTDLLMPYAFKWIGKVWSRGTINLKPVLFLRAWDIQLDCWMIQRRVPLHAKRKGKDDSKATTQIEAQASSSVGYKSRHCLGAHAENPH
ncbi:hypothetical protein FNV43_RR08168 [Rhamnella rubrinervis]|uniref:Uncharacterized protein n=1 Tax=Rhamnella rubrinervis TaxID=2594499 RepID=A0A8K0HG08_9ROSA|nr:hypothetical protein FNV43_RR08168 [Rhamnella rubrinervis]